MTPAAVLSGIPDNLLHRDRDPSDQLRNTKALADWLLASGHRPTWAEIEQERERRANPDAA